MVRLARVIRHLRLNNRVSTPLMEYKTRVPPLVLVFVSSTSQVVKVAIATPLYASPVVIFFFPLVHEIFSHLSPFEPNLVLCLAK